MIGLQVESKLVISILILVFTINLFNLCLDNIINVKIVQLN